MSALPLTAAQIRANKAAKPAAPKKKKKRVSLGDSPANVKMGANKGTNTSTTPRRAAKNTASNAPKDRPMGSVKAKARPTVSIPKPKSKATGTYSSRLHSKAKAATTRRAGAPPKPKRNKASKPQGKLIPYSGGMREQTNGDVKVSRKTEKAAKIGSVKRRAAAVTKRKVAATKLAKIKADQARAKQPKESKVFGGKKTGLGPGKERAAKVKAAGGPTGHKAHGLNKSQADKLKADAAARRAKAAGKPAPSKAKPAVVKKTGIKSYSKDEVAKMSPNRRKALEKRYGAKFAGKAKTGTYQKGGGGTKDTAKSLARKKAMAAGQAKKVQASKDRAAGKPTGRKYTAAEMSKMSPNRRKATAEKQAREAGKTPDQIKAAGRKAANSGKQSTLTKAKSATTSTAKSRATAKAQAAGHAKNKKAAELRAKGGPTDAKGHANESSNSYSNRLWNNHVAKRKRLVAAAKKNGTPIPAMGLSAAAFKAKALRERKK